MCYCIHFILFLNPIIHFHPHFLFLLIPIAILTCLTCNFFVWMCSFRLCIVCMDLNIHKWSYVRYLILFLTFYHSVSCFRSIFVSLEEGLPSNPLQYSCLENPMDRGTWRVPIHRVTKSWTQQKWLSMHARMLPCVFILLLKLLHSTPWHASTIFYLATLLVKGFH